MIKAKIALLFAFETLLGLGAQFLAGWMGFVCFVLAMAVMFWMTMGKILREAQLAGIEDRYARELRQRLTTQQRNMANHVRKNIGNIRRQYR